MGGRWRAREAVRRTLELRRVQKDRSRQPPRRSEPRVHPPTDKQVAILLDVYAKSGVRSINEVAVAVRVKHWTVLNCFDRGWLENVNRPRLTHAGHEIVREQRERDKLQNQ